MQDDSQEKLIGLMQSFLHDLVTDAGLQPPPLKQIAINPSDTLLALEEMLGINGGGMMLGEALEEWLSTPKELRTPIQFGDLMAKHEEMIAEIDAMVEADLANDSLSSTGA
jgi:hypothetical protein